MKSKYLIDILIEKQIKKINYEKAQDSFRRNSNSRIVGHTCNMDSYRNCSLYNKNKLI